MAVPPADGETASLESGTQVHHPEHPHPGGRYGVFLRMERDSMQQCERGAFKWIHVFFRCWKDGVASDECNYLAAFAKRSLPLSAIAVGTIL